MVSSSYYELRISSLYYELRTSTTDQPAAGRASVRKEASPTPSGRQPASRAASRASPSGRPEAQQGLPPAAIEIPNIIVPNINSNSSVSNTNINTSNKPVANTATSDVIINRHVITVMNERKTLEEKNSNADTIRIETSNLIPGSEWC